MNNQAEIKINRAVATITLGDVLDVSNAEEAANDGRRYVIGRPRYSISVQSWGDLVTCLMALEPSLTEGALRQQVFDSKTAIWKRAVEDGRRLHAD